MRDISEYEAFLNLLDVQFSFMTSSVVKAVKQADGFFGEDQNEVWNNRCIDAQKSLRACIQNIDAFEKFICNPEAPIADKTKIITLIANSGNIARLQLEKIILEIRIYNNLPKKTGKEIEKRIRTQNYISCLIKSNLKHVSEFINNVQNLLEIVYKEVYTNHEL